MESRFSRAEMLIGQGGLKTLTLSKVAVFGLGGVGSYTVEALARAGVGSFTLVDFDVVSISNINRQLHALENTVGMAKVDLMCRRVKGINPQAVVTAHLERYTAEQTEKLLAGPPDYVVDAIDDLEGKVQLIKYCLSRGIPVVSSMGAGNKLDPTLFRVDDISRTTVCPLARVVRRRLRQEGITSGLKVVFSTEQPCRPDPVENNGTQKIIPGSISFVPPVAGMILAGVVVTDLLKGADGVPGVSMH